MAASSQDASDLVGTVIDGRYRVLRSIGRGGMGEVLLGEHVELGKRCAIKVLLDGWSAKDESTRRFLREARLASSIAHPNVVTVLDTGVLGDERAYIAMELLAGEDLATTLARERRLPWPRVRHIVLQLCDALAAVHLRGVVHRDLKPHNCFRITRGRDQDFIKILDFGIAKSVAVDAMSGTLTTTGQVIGTPHYMAPEQAQGAPLDPRVDVFALGVMIYQLLTGELPFSGDNPVQVLAAVLTREPLPMRQVAPSAGIPAALDDVVARALAKEPERRFGSTRELGNALAAVSAVAVRGDDALAARTSARSGETAVPFAATAPLADAAPPPVAGGSPASGATTLPARPRRGDQRKRSALPVAVGVALTIAAGLAIAFSLDPDAEVGGAPAGQDSVATLEPAQAGVAPPTMDDDNHLALDATGPGSSTSTDEIDPATSTSEGAGDAITTDTIVEVEATPKSPAASAAAIDPRRAARAELQEALKKVRTRCSTTLGTRDVKITVEILRTGLVGKIEIDDRIVDEPRRCIQAIVQRVRAPPQRDSLREELTVTLRRSGG